MSGLGAEVLCPGHGPPICRRGAGAQTALAETAELLESLVEQTLVDDERGRRARRASSTRSARPRTCSSAPTCDPIYDEPEFVVRNIWRLYGGWYDGNPAHLKPGPYAALAREMAGLSGGATRLIATRRGARARRRPGAGLPPGRDGGCSAAPDDGSMRKARAALYTARADSEKSLMAKGIFASVAREGGG